MADFCCPLRCPGLAPNKGNGKRGTWAWPGFFMGASWPSGELAPSGRGCHKLPPDVNAGWPGTREFGRAAKSAGSSGARRHPGRNVRMKIGKQSQPGMHYASTWLSGFISLSHLQAHPRLLRVCAHMCRCMWHVTFVKCGCG